MKKIYIIGCLIGACLSLNAQTDCAQLTEVFKRTPFCGNTLALEVEMFNATSKHFGLEDTIAYRCENGIKYYTYLGKPLVDWTPGAGNDFELKARSSERYGNKMEASIALENGKHQVYELACLGEQFDQAVLRSYTTEKGLPIGSFHEQDCNKNTLIRGNYTIKDTTFFVESKSIDPISYETISIKKEFNRLALRTGNWIYYGEKGEKISEENYPGLQSQRPETGFCNPFRGPVPVIGQRLTAAFQRFNDLAYLLKQPLWLSVDNAVYPPVYYFNGREVEATVKISSNKQETITLAKGQVSIELTLDVPTSGKPDKEAPVYLKASVSYADGSGELLVLDDEDLRYFELQNGEKSGLYRKRDCQGNILTKGQYCQKDTLYRDTFMTINPDTYESEVKIIAYHSVTKRLGNWKYYLPSGAATKEEDFGDCEDQ